MNRLANTDRCRVLACLVEGNSIRATGLCARCAIWSWSIILTT